MGVVQFDGERLKRLIVESLPEETRPRLEDKGLGECVEMLVLYNRNLKAEMTHLADTLANIEYDSKTVAAAKALVAAHKMFDSICSA